MLAPRPLDAHEEGILHADLDVPFVAVAKAAAGPVEHRSRPDAIPAPGEV